MNTILEFLNNKFKSNNDNSEEFVFSNQELLQINAQFKNRNVNDINSKHLRLSPKIQKNQIWSVKEKYIDFMGITQKSKHPFLVLIVDDLNDIEEEDFVRVNVLSPFTEFASSDDFICNDYSVIGFPFLIETWNEQPILVEILNNYLGYFDVDSISSLLKNDKKEIIINESQFKFRDLEVSRAKFLNNSVSSLLLYFENRQTESGGVVISINNKNVFPKYYNEYDDKAISYMEVTEPITEYLQASKTGFTSKDNFFHHKVEDLIYDILVKKNDEGFIICILSIDNIKLFLNDNIEINGVSNSEKTVFSNLKNGLYTLTTEQIKESIKIRLK
jgi:hypothetical protein